MEKISQFTYDQPIQSHFSRIVDGTLEQNNYAPGTHLRIWHNCQKESYSAHHHSAMEVIFCEDSPYTVFVNDQKYLLKQGDFLFIPCHMMHRIECKNNGSRFICLFSMDFINSFQDLKAMEPIFEVPYLCTRKTEPEIYSEIYDSFMEIFHIYFSNEALWEVAIYHQLLQVFLAVGQQYYSAMPDSLLTDRLKNISFDDYASLLNYIDTHFAENLTLDHVAAKMGFSKYYFSRLFKQTTGFTFYNYLSRKRIATAQLMLSTDLPVTDIAFKAGFNNLSSFCRCFKQHTGYSPSQYRHLMLKKES